MQTDIIIIGTGISVKLTALYLNLHGFNVIVFHNQDVNQDKSNLVTFLSSGSIKFLNKILGENRALHNYEDIKQLCCIHHNQLDKDNFQFNFDNNKEDFLGKIVPNNKISELLDQLIHSNDIIFIFSFE